MKRWFIALKLLFIWGCMQPEHKHIEQEPYPSKDSILGLADEVLDLLIEKKASRIGFVDSIKNQLYTNRSLSANQMQQLRQQLYLHKEKSDEYESELVQYQTKRKVRRDTIIYHFVHDTIRHMHTIVDTQTITVYDTVYIKKFWNRRKNR